MKPIDLRSDTVTLPTEAMKKAMFEAPLGDDVYGEDPTVNRLQEKIAALLGKEAALFTPSGTQSNLLALLAHCNRGDEYIVGQDAHTYKYEGGGAAVLGSIQPQPIHFESDGTLNLDKVKKVIKPKDQHFARTRLLCLENTMGGKVLPLDYLSEARDFVNINKLGLHLDGARLFNAAVKLGVNVKALADPFDSVSVCLSKGLGSPAGSVLVGNKALIEEARHYRKMLGGGMRQVGLLAAAGIHALDSHVERLIEDHQNAATLARALGDMQGVAISEEVQTNMVFIKVAEPLKLANYLKEQNIIISPDSTSRLVTHLDISAEDIQRVIKAFDNYFNL